MYRLPKQDPTGGEEVKTAGAPVAVRNAVSDEGFSNSGRGGRAGGGGGASLDQFCPEKQRRPDTWMARGKPKPQGDVIPHLSDSLHQKEHK